MKNPSLLSALVLTLVAALTLAADQDDESDVNDSDDDDDGVPVGSDSAPLERTVP